MKRGTKTTITGQVISLTYQKPEPKQLPPETKKRRVNLALAPYWHEAGKRRAEHLGVSFSHTVETLIYADSLHNESA